MFFLFIESNMLFYFFFFFQAEDGIRDGHVTGVQTCALPISFWHSLVGVGADGRPTTRVLTWADTRARNAAATLRREVDPVATHARTGCVLHASYLPAKLRWLREHDADAYARTTWWMSLGEYLYLRILGARRAGHGMASATGLYDQRARRWDRPLLSHLVVGEETLSPIDDAPLTAMLSAFARRWPALANAKWVPAVGDGACSNVGAGAVGRDTASLFLGTSGASRCGRRAVDRWQRTSLDRRGVPRRRRPTRAPPRAGRTAHRAPAARGR